MLDFSYPCESTEVTLRLSNRVPFYNSADPNLSQDPNHQISNDNATESGKCSLRLTINPVSRDDMGTYILTAYKDGNMIDYTRVWLNVECPLGCVSCESMEYYGEWVKLHCRAPVGSLPGQVECFQSGIRMPPLTAAEENGLILSQVMLARLVEDPVYCCYSILGKKQNMCECKDWAWDPVRDSNHDMADPCPKPAVSSAGPTTPDGPMEHIAFSSSSSPASPTQLIHSNMSVSESHNIGWISLSIFCVGLCFVCCHALLLFFSPKYLKFVRNYFTCALFAPRLQPPTVQLSETEMLRQH